MNRVTRHTKRSPPTAEEIKDVIDFPQTSLNLINNLGTDHSGSGLTTIDTVGESVSVGDVLYMKSDGKWWKADADATTTMPGAGLAMQAITANNDCKILLYGFFRDDSWAYTIGKILFVSTAPGPPTETAPAGSGDQVQVVGIAITVDIILFNPSYELVEVS